MNNQLERGFSLIMALFWLVVISVLAAVMFKTSGLQHATVDTSLKTARAYLAARSGIEWATYRAVTNDLCQSDSWESSALGLEGFSIQTTCQRTTHPEADRTIYLFKITAHATFGGYGDFDFVSRTLAAKVIRTVP